MNVTFTPLEGVYLAESTPIEDHRGSFSRLFCNEDLRDVVGKRQIKQINHSITHKIGTVRGLHLQNEPFAEMKLIRCIRGKIWDVAVDFRENSRTFLKWYGVELNRKNNKMIIIPEGCAHGFQVLEKDSEMLYLHTAFYSVSSERGIHPKDPTVAINWPLELKNLSSRDANLPYVDDQFKGWRL